MKLKLKNKIDIGMNEKNTNHTVIMPLAPFGVVA